MRNVLAFMLGLLLALAVGVAQAQTTCQRWRLVAGDGTITESSHGKLYVCQQHAPIQVAYASASSGWTYTMTGAPELYSSNSGCRVNTNRCADGGGSCSAQLLALGNFVNAGMGSCDDDPCAVTKQLADPVVLMGATASSGQLCGHDDGSGGLFSGGLYGKGCQVVKRGSGIESASGHWYGQVSYTGVSCGSAVTPINTASTANCVATGGTSVCVSRSEVGKVTAAGETVDARSVPDNGCALMGNGGAMCESGAPDGPKDSSDDPLPPTATLTATAEPAGSTEGATTTINYYNDVAVSSSYTIVTGEGTSGAEGSAGGEGESLDDLEGGEMDTAEGFGESAGGFWDRVEGSPLVSAVSGISGSLTGGACPAWSDTIEAGAFGTYELDFSFICAMWDDVAPVISAVMLAVFAFAALRILMSA